MSVYSELNELQAAKKSSPGKINKMLRMLMFFACFKILKNKIEALYYFLAFFCFSASSIAFCNRAEKPPAFLGFFLFSSI